MAKLIKKNKLENESKLKETISELSSPVGYMNNTVTGFVKFKSQLNRQGFVPKQGPHEGRFVNFNQSPDILSKYKKIPQFSFDNLDSHSSSTFLTTNTNLLYIPKYNCVDTRILMFIIGINKGFVSFNKMIATRAKIQIDKPYIADTSDPDKIHPPKFDKQLKLPETVPLPRFLIVKSIKIIENK